VEFAQVVAGGEQGPLAAGVVQPAEQDVFALQGGDLAENRFDDRLAAGIGGLTGLGAELAGHPLLERVVGRDPAARCRLDDLVVPSRPGAIRNSVPVCSANWAAASRFASEQYPASARACLGARPVLRRACSIIGVKVWLSAAQFFRSVAMIT
jgi:hypothetical protein